MIVVVGRVQSDASRREELVRLGEAMAAASREETGCIDYRLYEDIERENHFLFVEEWESQAALEQHFATSHVRRFMSEIPATIVAPPDVKFHTVASTRNLADVGFGRGS